jgi:hypothetical protein
MKLREESDEKCQEKKWQNFLIQFLRQKERKLLREYSNVLI